jgi:dipeptidyl-peptidase III
MLIGNHSRAAWHGTGITLSQTSPESNDIYDMIIFLYDYCKGDWNGLAASCEVDEQEMQAFLDYAACFLSDTGNYYMSHNAIARPRHADDFQRALEIRNLFPTCLPMR